MNSLLRQTLVGRYARHLRWSLAGNTGTLAGRLSVQSAPPMMEAETAGTWIVRVENHSRRIWARSGPGAMRLRHRWIGRTGTEAREAAFTALPKSLLPGDWADIPVAVTGPAAVGDFTVTWDLDAGAPIREIEAISLPVPVTFPRSKDIDYHHVYQSADLAENSWWVVGAYHSREEFLRSSLARRDMLVDEGLTPDSRVLDIGCGTGQMAMALEDYLTDRGAFYGTDIGREGIEYCKHHYKRPNFKFETGGMTTVPFATTDGPFDMAIFFSVFTHTFVDESMLLLAEAKRLLGPKGVVIGDFITSELVERGAGNRGQMWVNRDHFLRLAGELGFRTKVIGTVPWAPDATRLMVRFSKS